MVQLKMDEHSPSPTHDRAIYGFVLYLGSCMGLAIYLMWAYVSDAWLQTLGITYFPQRAWALCGPTYMSIMGVFVLSLYFAYNHLLTPPMDSVSTITDMHGKPVHTKRLPVDSIPPIGDLCISEINHTLYSRTDEIEVLCEIIVDGRSPLSKSSIM